MLMSDIQIKLRGLIQPVSTDEVDLIAAEFQTDLPTGYKKYVSALGKGRLASLIRVYPPRQLISNTREFRKRISKHWLWTKTHDLLSKERALECVVVADTVNGDELIYHPSNTRELFFLPRGGDKTLVAGKGLLDALEWILTQRYRIKDRSFEPAHKPLYLTPIVPAVTGTYSSLKVGEDCGRHWVSGLEFIIVGSKEGFYAIIQQHAGIPTITRIHFDFEETGKVNGRNKISARFTTPKSSPLGEAEFRGTITNDALKGTLRFADVKTKYSLTKRDAWTFTLPRKASLWQSLS